MRPTFLLIALLTAGSLFALSCASTNPVESEVDVAAGLPVGSVLVFRYEGDPELDTTRITLVSKDTTMGGRDSLIAFRFQNDEMSYWDLRTPGEIWHYYRTAHLTFDERDGTWIRFPRGNDADTHIVIIDTTFIDPVQVRTDRFREEMTIRFISADTIVIGARRVPIRRVLGEGRQQRWKDNGLYMDLKFNVTYSLFEDLGLYSRIEYDYPELTVADHLALQLVRIDEK